MKQAKTPPVEEKTVCSALEKYFCSVPHHEVHALSREHRNTRSFRLANVGREAALGRRVAAVWEHGCGKRVTRHSGQSLLEISDAAPEAQIPFVISAARPFLYFLIFCAQGFGSIYCNLLFDDPYLSYRVSGERLCERGIIGALAHDFLSRTSITCGAASCERPMSSSLEGRAMQTRTKTKWLETQDVFGAISLNTVTTIASILAVVALLTIAITEFANIQMASMG
jgi:hypothetical protein